MHLTIWSTSYSNRVRTLLAPVLNQAMDIKVTVVQDHSVPEGTNLLLALGKEPLEFLQAAGAIAKGRATTSQRTKPHLYGTTPLLVSYSPDIGDIDHGFFVDLLTDVGLSIRYLRTGHWTPVVGKPRYVTDFSELVEKIKHKHAADLLAGGSGMVDVSFDLETLGLDPYALPLYPFPGAFIVTMQATCDYDTADVIRFGNRVQEIAWLSDPVHRAQLEFLLTCDYIRLRGSDFKFDQGWLWERAKIRPTNFTFDTTLVGSLLDENRSNALDVHTKIYAPLIGGYSDAFDNTIKKERMDLVPPETMLPYAGGDVMACQQVADVERQELLAQPKLARFYVNILHPAAKAFAELEQGGMCVDRAAYLELKADLEAEHLRLVGEAKKILGGRIVIKHGDSSKVGGLNLTKPSLLKDFMFSPMGLNLKPLAFTEKPDKDGIPRPATDEDHLLMFEDVPEAQAFLTIYKADSQVMKTYNSYVIGFMEDIRSDGRFHPNYFLFVGNKQKDDGGAVTGRLSCKHPAFQTIPKHTIWAMRIRRCFPAPPGYVVVERDYNQGELRVIACMANETNMIQAYKEGKDLHSKTAGPFRGYNYDAMMLLKQTDKALFDAIRQLGKAGNFGLVFKMQWEGFQAYAKNNYKVSLSDQEAQDFRDGFFKEYPRLLPFHAECEAIAHKYKEISTPLGRVRHLPLIDSKSAKMVAKAERQSINSPVQGTLTDMVLWTIALEHKQGLHKIAPHFGACHDSVLNYVPEDRVDELLPGMMHTMENLPFEIVEWAPQLKFLADAKIGKNMGEMVEQKK